MFPFPQRPADRASQSPEGEFLNQPHGGPRLPGQGVCLAPWFPESASLQAAEPHASLCSGPVGAVRGQSYAGPRRARLVSPVHPRAPRHAHSALARSPLSPEVAPGPCSGDWPPGPVVAPGSPGVRPPPTPRCAPRYSLAHSACSEPQLSCSARGCSPPAPSDNAVRLPQGLVPRE